VILGIIFLVDAFTKQEFTQIQPELLGLLGISNGAYLGLKIPENQTNSESKPSESKKDA